MSEPGIQPSPSAQEKAVTEPSIRATPPPVPPEIKPENWLSAGQWGMIAFLLSDVALFSTLIVAYVAYIGKDTVGPTPMEALSLPLVLVTTFFLLSSSVTVHLAEKALHGSSLASFQLWWGLTMGLGCIFLVGTAYEWYELITHHHLTIGRNLFGTTYYTLVGFHGMHVASGVVIMGVVLGLALRGQITRSSEAVGLVAWYWHFVDVVWVVVFTVVYLFGR